MSHTERTTWRIAPLAPKEFFSETAGVPPIVAQVLWARGLHDVEAMQHFLADEPDTADPTRMRDMPRAVDRILRAIDAHEQIAVYGDYDCDGVTACALLNQAFTALGASARIYIPNRFEEGYGLHADALDILHAEGVSLVVTVDCGARAQAEAARAREIGLDLVVTDHHEMGDHHEVGEGFSPDGAMAGSACALVNPRRPDCPYLYKSLAGVGIAYRLVQALLRSAPGRLHGRSAEDLLDSLLDLVAIGTVADVVPLDGENRQLVRAGLRRINSQPRLGLLHLARAAAVQPGHITAQTLGFTLAPRLNAAGRIDTALDAYTLLSTTEESVAQELAERLNSRNAERQKITAAVAHSAEEKALAEDRNTPLLFAVDSSYNAGVIGLAASRLVERFYRPAVVVTITGDGPAGQEARGSCRSVEGFNITAALDECKDLLGRYGGHTAAAGFTLPANRLAQLRERLIQVAQAQQPEGGWIRPVPVDSKVNLHTVSLATYEQLACLEPYGMGNPRPLFAALGISVHSVRRVGQPPEQPPHLSLRLRDARSALWEAIGWRMGERAGELNVGAKIDVAFQLDVNEWNGERRLQLVLQDFRPAQR